MISGEVLLLLTPRMAAMHCSGVRLSAKVSAHFDAQAWICLILQNDPVICLDKLLQCCETIGSFEEGQFVEICRQKLFWHP